MEEKCIGLKKEVALQEKQTGDVDRQLDETTRELSQTKTEPGMCRVVCLTGLIQEKLQ